MAERPIRSGNRSPPPKDGPQCGRNFLYQDLGPDSFADCDRWGWTIGQAFGSRAMVRRSRVRSATVCPPSHLLGTPMTHNAPAIVGRQARALRILTCLQAGPGFNASELASQLQVSRRTIFRDLDLIRRAGVQFYFDDRLDAYRLSYKSQHMEPPQFNEQELALFVLMAHLSMLQHFPGFGLTGREAAAKLLCAYPYAQRISVSRLLNACVCHPPEEEPPPAAAALLRTILEAIRSQRRLRLVTCADDLQYSYRTKFDPYRVQLSANEWSVTGHSSVHRGQLTLGMRAIQIAELTAESYEVPRGFRRRPPAAV